ncbi:MAG TPA: hypothetical protein VNT60_10025, partial [Deinococcales bacterium]|nr:hypothetical protein [Deinococcales bacterium]
MRKLILAAVLTLAGLAAAQTAAAPAKLTIVDTEVTVPAGPGKAPWAAVGFVSEIRVPLEATDAAGAPVANVEITWSVQNSGKAPVYVVAARDGGTRKVVTITVEPGKTATLKTTTGPDGKTWIMLNANQVAQAKIAATSGNLRALNLRDVAH